MNILEIKKTPTKEHSHSTSFVSASLGYTFCFLQPSKKWYTKERHLNSLDLFLISIILKMQFVLVSIKDNVNLYTIYSIEEGREVGHLFEESLSKK